MARRTKHQDKHIEALLYSLEEQSWRVTKGSGYFKALCPCGTHKKWVHLTPSGSSYLRNLAGWLRRTGCWREGK